MVRLLRLSLYLNNSFRSSFISLKVIFIVISAFQQIKYHGLLFQARNKLVRSFKPLRHLSKHQRIGGPPTALNISSGILKQG
jgi:hypothetical protein